MHTSWISKLVSCFFELPYYLECLKTVVPKQCTNAEFFCQMTKSHHSDQETLVLVMIRWDMTLLSHLGEIAMFTAANYNNGKARQKHSRIKHEIWENLPFLSLFLYIHIIYIIILHIQYSCIWCWYWWDMEGYYYELLYRWFWDSDTFYKHWSYINPKPQICYW